MQTDNESISRLAFLKQLGLSGSALLAFYCAGTLMSCSKSDMDVEPLDANGITLDLTTPAYASLKTIGSYTYSGNILVARIKNGSYIALSKKCTHEGSTVQYIASSDSINCPNHGARFSTTGAVTQGPATRSLTQYKTTVSADGNSLLITNA
ncbi:Rieske (2Fe-2S) protein [Nibrella viscosa]|uniref:Rieske (2Fe-2S) protein n=1 Tax=Nibrella viscosa TaxID=1084524 RepID=A0ABP8KSU8_9BACT